MTADMPAPMVLENDLVRLEPLTLGHLPDLFAASGGDEEVWRWLPAETPRTEEDLAKVARYLLEDDRHLPLAVIVKETGTAAGWTTYIDVPGFEESIEIGWTWYGRAWWRSGVNTGCKLLLIDHAFDKLGHNRVQLKTDILNVRSQNAIKRIGGVHEGTFRRHRRRPDGTWRDTACFGILDEEWPAHRTRLTRSHTHPGG